MPETIVTIDIESLREDLRSEDLGAYIGGGFGGALMETYDIDNATPEELVKIAQDRGVDLWTYVVGGSRLHKTLSIDDEEASFSYAVNKHLDPLHLGIIVI